MIRILQFVNTLSRSNGVMSIIMNYYRHLDKSKIQFDFLYYKERDNNFVSEIEELGGKIYKLDFLYNLFEVKKEFENFFEREKGNYEIIHIHSLPFARLMKKAAKKNGIEHMILHIHATKYSEIWPLNMLYNLLCINIDRVSDDLCACSDLAAEYAYSKKVVKSGRVRIINNAIECEDFRFNEEKRNRIREEFNIPSDGVMLGAVGVLYKVKNHLFLIDVFKRYIEKHPNAYLAIAGVGSLFEEIEKKINDYSLQDNVHLLGFRNDVPDILSAFDVFILPSISEGYPVSVLEAQSSGLPCILSDSVTKEVQITYCDFVSLKGDVAKWCYAIFDAVNKSKNQSRDLAYKIVEDAGYSIEKEAYKLYAYYCNLSQKDKIC